MQDLWPYAALIAAAVVPNGVWRWIAVFATARLDDRSSAFIWVRHVATCLVAGVVAQLMIAPPGALATAPAWMRFGALGGAALVWVLRRNVYLAWATAVAAMIAGVALLPVR